MKNFLPFFFLLIFVTAAAQETPQLNYEKPSKFQGKVLTLWDTPQLNDSVIKIENWNSRITPKIEKESPLPQQNNAVRDEWLKKGGLVRYSTVSLSATYFRLDLAKSGLSSSSKVITGYGGGYSVFTNFINLKMPEYTTGVSRWNSFNFGIGLDVVIYGFKLPSIKTTIPPSSTMTMEMSAMAMNMRIVGNFGWTVAQGKYIDEGTWKGVALTLKYRPSFDFMYTGVTTTTTVTPSNPYVTNGDKTTSSGTKEFNPKGFGFDIDFTSYSAKMEKLAPRPKSKISFFMLPPVGSNPLFISLGYGLTFYPRQHRRLR